MRWVRISAILALSACSEVATAHGSVQGLGSFFSGVVHPIFEPAQLLVIVALGLLLGQRGWVATRPSVTGFAGGVAMGLIAAWNGSAPQVDSAMLVMAGLIGLAVLATLPVPQRALTAVATAVGLGIGVGSGPESVTGTARLVMLLGSGVGACIWLFNVASMVLGARRHWMHIGVRVAGSWIVASTTLVLALWTAGPSRGPGSVATVTGPVSLTTSPERMESTVLDSAELHTTRKPR